jgi:pimeloyl-ACP methyl ester carboxylesterase
MGWHQKDRPPKLWANNDFRVKLGTAIPGLRMFAINYKNKNSSSFSANSDVPYSCEGDNIQTIKKSFKANKIAICQVDVLGHSMGGLLARIWAESGMGWYFRNDNYWMGDIHKLITLDSPHYGSFLADLGIGCIQYPYTGWKLIKKGMILERAEKAGYSFTNGALFDLMTTSIPIRTMDNTPTVMASHAIAGYYAVSNLNSIPACYQGIHKQLKSLGFDPSPYLITGQSDLVVSVDSQAGGFSSYTLDVFSHHHMAATTDNVVANMAELLNAPSKSGLFGEGFPEKE